MEQDNRSSHLPDREKPLGNKKILIACADLGKLQEQIETSIRQVLLSTTSISVVRSSYQILSILKDQKYDGIIAETDLAWSALGDAENGSVHTPTLRELFSKYDVTDGIDTIFDQPPLAWLQSIADSPIIWLDFFSPRNHSKKGLIISEKSRVHCKERTGSRKITRYIPDKNLPALEQLLQEKFVSN